MDTLRRPHRVSLFAKFTAVIMLLGIVPIVLLVTVLQSRMLTEYRASLEDAYQDAIAYSAYSIRAGIGQFFHLDGLAAALCAAPQKVVTGNIIVIRNLHHKFKAAFPDAFLIMGKLRLADAKLLRRLFLGNAPLFAQQGNDAVKFHCHLVAILHTLPERSAQRPHRVCTTSPGRRGRTFRRFLQHLRGRHAPAVLFSALRVCTAACRLTPCRACGR